MGVVAPSLLSCWDRGPKDLAAGRQRDGAASLDSLQWATPREHCAHEQLRAKGRYATVTRAMVCRWKGRTARQARPRTTSSTSSACLSTFTFGKILRIVPSLSMMNVVRSIPM